jgi:hypothetical protein
VLYRAVGRGDGFLEVVVEAGAEIAKQRDRLIPTSASTELGPPLK